MDGIRVYSSLDDDRKWAANASKTYSGVVITDDIRENGRKKILIIGKTGTGKSSLCNVIAGHPHNAEIFPVSGAASSCTQSTKFAEIFFNLDKERPASLIDTIGFDDPDNDTDANIISELVMKLKNKVDYVNLFIIAVNGQNPRLDAALVGTIRIFEGMFGKDFWNQAVIVFTRLSMDSKAVKKRSRNNEGKSDETFAAEYLETLKNKFPNSRGLSYLLMDACYDEDDDDEKDSFNGAMSKMWNLVDKAGGLPTRKVQQVETESKKLKNDIEKKDKMLKAIDEKSKETEKLLEETRKKNAAELEEMRKANKISQEEQNRKMAEMDAKYKADMGRLQSERKKIEERAYQGEKGFFKTIGECLDVALNPLKWF